jgi:hypothetical protein
VVVMVTVVVVVSVDLMLPHACCQSVMYKNTVLLPCQGTSQQD